MSAGKKRSGFQITSVTSDYSKAGSEGRKESFGSDPGSPGLSPLTNGGQSLHLRSPRGSPRGSPHSSPPTSANTHPAKGTDTLPHHVAPISKEADIADDARAAQPQSHENGTVLPVVIGSKGLTVPSDTSGTLVMPHANAVAVSQPGSSSTVIPVNGEASNGSYPASGGTHLPMNPANEHAFLVNGTTSPPESKAGSSNGAIPKNGPLSSMMNGSVVSPVTSAGHVATSSSRFRVVKLDQGLGEPYKKGRWTCVDFYDKDMDNHSISRILDSMRHGHSLDSHLEAAGLSLKPVTQFRPQSPSKGHGTSFVHSQGTAHPVLHNPGLNVTSPHQARSFSGLPQMSLEGLHSTGLKSPVSARTSPTKEFHSLLPLPRTSDAGKGTSDAQAATSWQEASRTLSSEGCGLGNSSTKEQSAGIGASGTSSQGPPGFRTLPVVVVDEPGTAHPRDKSNLQPIPVDDRRPAPAHDARSRSPSPARPGFRDSSPSYGLSDPFGVHSARLSLARSMFSMGGTPDSDEESGPSSSMVAIDNKIEQAMDLVKTHLMFAVREEVEVLREQIKDLMERNSHLEQENTVLKSLASPEQLSEMQAKMQSLRLGLVPPSTNTTTA
ncbi:TSC22 domain family protein 4 [Ambystoma mexicanum]|uniref:TSC22 domain family protein 4 n=1 Tax=Ambystoma mexicanum TaxID=8296 RepID=UPI0037E70759